MQNGFLLQKATPISWDCGHKTHQVDDDVLGKVGPHVRMQMIANGGNHSEYVIVRSCGKGAFIPCSDFQPPIDVERRELLREICVQANKRIAYIGFWVLAWDNAYRPKQWFAMWFDHEGDEHVYIDDVQTWEKQRVNGVDAYLRVMNDALVQYFEAERSAELLESQRISQALGEKPTAH